MTDICYTPPNRKRLKTPNAPRKSLQTKTEGNRFLDIVQNSPPFPNEVWMMIAREMQHVGGYWLRRPGAKRKLTY